MTLEELQAWFEAASRVGANCKAQMMATLRTDSHMSPEQMDRLEASISHALAVEIVNTLADKISGQPSLAMHSLIFGERLDPGLIIYDTSEHPCRDCGKPFEAHPQPDCEAWV